MKAGLTRLLFVATVIFGSLFALPGRAQSIIKQPGNHPKYDFELEPHLLVAFGSPGYVGGEGFGLGVRGSVPIVDNGFVTTINNSVAISFGLDWVHYDGYDGRYRGCYNNGNRDFNCVVFANDQDNINYVWIPVTLQWNFWLSPKWSVMGEIGPGFRYSRYEYYNDSDLDLDPVLYAGARWHFAESVALTMRLGFPTSSIGFSFLL